MGCLLRRGGVKHKRNFPVFKASRQEMTKDQIRIKVVLEEISWLSSFTLLPIYARVKGTARRKWLVYTGLGILLV